MKLRDNDEGLTNVASHDLYYQGGGAHGTAVVSHCFSQIPDRDKSTSANYLHVTRKNLTILLGKVD